MQADNVVGAVFMDFQSDSLAPLSSRCGVWEVLLTQQP
jgi:hypothetical protein